jgi:hypothetical protein
MSTSAWSRDAPWLVTSSIELWTMFLYYFLSPLQVSPVNVRGFMSRFRAVSIFRVKMKAGSTVVLGHDSNRGLSERESCTSTRLCSRTSNHSGITMTRVVEQTPLRNSRTSCHAGITMTRVVEQTPLRNSRTSCHGCITTRLYLIWRKCKR